MKKFVIVMISFLVLFVFFMLNYLLWDKENLQKQSATDKIEQDWLRGQNKTLQTTVEEQEQTISTLKKERDEYQSRIIELEQQLRHTKSLQENATKQVDTLNQVIHEYQLLIEDKLKAFTGEWFKSITEERYEEAYAFMAESYQLFGRYFMQEDYIAAISTIKSISLMKQTEEQEKLSSSFKVLKGQGQTFDIVAEALVDLTINEEKEPQFNELTGNNHLLQITYRYYPSDQKWAIISVMVTKSAKP